MKVADSQATNAVRIISQAKWIGLLSLVAAKPAMMVPSRIARNVPPSISALPAGNSSRAKRSGRMPYFTGPNSAPRMPNSNSAANSTGSE